MPTKPLTNLTKDDLIDFEQDILECFENKQIKAPVHLSNGDENELVEIFTGIREQDHVCCTWRSHYQCLLKGVPPEKLKQKILDGHSISLCFKEYNIISSAIVGGICPIALGIAMGIKDQGKDEKVYCFVGDMSATTGIFHECYEYAYNYNLPIVWVVSDNDKSVCSPTSFVCNYSKHPFYNSDKVIYYQYNNKFPHVGGTTKIIF